MKKLLFVLIAFVVLAACPVSEAQITGSLTTGDSIKIVDPGYNKIVEIFLTDSASTADTVVVEYLNPINNTYTQISVIDQLSNTRVSVLVPGVSVSGKLYQVPLDYPAVLRLRKTDVDSLSEKIYYNIRVK